MHLHHSGVLHAVADAGSRLSLCATAVPSMDSAVRSRKALGRAAAWTVYETVFGVHAPVIELVSSVLLLQ